MGSAVEAKSCRVGHNCGSALGHFRHHRQDRLSSDDYNGIYERFHKAVLNESIVLRSARRCMVRSMNCKPNWMRGSQNIMRRGLIRDADASAKTQLQTFLDAMPRTREKIIAA